MSWALWMCNAISADAVSGRGLQDGVSRMGVKAIVWYGAAVAVGASRLLGAQCHAVRGVRVVLSVRIVRRCSQLGCGGPASSRLLCTARTAQHGVYSVSRHAVRRIVLGCCLLECLCGSQGQAGVGAVAHTLSHRAVGVCAFCGANSCTRLIVPVFRHPGRMRPAFTFLVSFLSLPPVWTCCLWRGSSIKYLSSWLGN